MARRLTGRRRSGGRWVEVWDPEEEVFWRTTGRRIARKNLVLSIFAEHIAFCTWALWTVVVLNLGNIGISLTVSELFLLTAAPNLVGAVLRIPYTFAVPRFGGRAWTTISSALLLIPAVLLAAVVPSGWLERQDHQTQLWVLLLSAATAGFGGANFSSSMANISFFFPEREKGLALGLNAAGGNLGVAVAQLLVPLVIAVGVPSSALQATGHQVHLGYAGLMWLPLIAVAVIAAWLWMDSLVQARTDTSSYVHAVRTGQTWIVSLLYIGTFGSFIGFSFARPLVLKNTFPSFLVDHPFVATYLGGLGFLGALLGSLSRPLGGWLSDKLGGARVTLAVFVGMALCCGTAIVGVRARSFLTFFGSTMAMFLLSGVGNGSTYKMIPTIFAALGRKEAELGGRDPRETQVEFKRRAAAVIGITGAVGAFGGFLVQLVIRHASSAVSKLLTEADTPAEKLAVATAHSDWSVPALSSFLLTYLVLALVTWFFYVRVRASSEDRRTLAELRWPFPATGMPPTPPTDTSPVVQMVMSRR